MWRYCVEKEGGHCGSSLWPGANTARRTGKRHGDRDCDGDGGRARLPGQPIFSARLEATLVAAAHEQRAYWPVLFEWNGIATALLLLQNNIWLSRLHEGKAESL